LPRLAGWNVLELAIQSALRQVQGVGNPGHRLEADEVAIDGRRRRVRLRRPDDNGPVFRAQQDVEKERKFGIERFARDVLPVADNLGRALSALPGDADAVDPALKNVIVGVQATERELQSVLERHGITRIEALGKPFNAEFHQAMMEVEDPSVPAGTVVQELIPGYLIAGRLLRAAMVGVSKGGPAIRPASNEN